MQVTTGGKLPDQYNSKEKQIVRNKQWIPLFREIVSTISPQYIHYLCFPSPSCAFIKQLLSTNLLVDESSVIAIEKSDSAATEIITKFSTFFKEGKYDVIIKKYEEAIKNIELIELFRKSRIGRIGFDILELDFTDSIFSMNNNGESRILDTIIKTLMLQSVFGRREIYYLILSFKMSLSIPPILRLGCTDAVDMLCKNFIKRYNVNLADKINNISNSNNDESRVNWCILYSIPLILIEYAPNIVHMRLKDTSYTYISRSVGAKARIASFIFTCQNRCASLSQSVGSISEEIHDAFDKVSGTVWVKL